MTDDEIAEIATTALHAWWVVDTHSASARSGARPRCTICGQWWPCDLAGLAALAVRLKAENETLRRCIIPPHDASA